MKLVTAPLLAAAFLFALTTAAPAQTMPMNESGSATKGQTPAAKPPLSPPMSANVQLGGKAITIKYGSPAMRGRKIMGELVPYGKVWRTGANPATSFTTEADLMIGSLRVPAGNYTLYTLPAAPGTPWMLIINRQTGQWGTVYQQEQDLGRTEMQAKTLSAPQESMSISFEKTSGNSTELHVKWESTDQWVAIKTAK